MTAMRFLDLPVAFTNPAALPLIVDEPMLVNGSLALIDPAHPWNPMGSGTVDGQVVPNLAWRNAQTIIPTGTQASLSATVRRSGNDTGYLKTEKTSTGAFHGIANNTVFYSHEASIEAGTDLTTYLNANFTHSFFVALSHRITRPATGTGKMSYSDATQTNARALWAFDWSGDLPPSGNANRAGADRLADNTDDTAAGLVYRSLGVTGGVYSTFGSFASPFEKIEFWKTGRNSNWESGTNATQASHILYSFYLEDLTVSGRTFANVNMLAKARHQALFAAGGRYAGDSWTNPASTTV